MKTIDISCYGENFNIAFYTDKYGANDSLYIEGVLIEDGVPVEPWGSLTTCIPGVNLKDNEVILDTNNSNEMVKKAAEAKIVTLTGRVASSGYCNYPIATVNQDILKEYLVA